jgi:predicted nucleotidyltransferase
MNASELLTAAQRSAVEALLRQETRARTHVVVALSGAHAYGFPSPDSDVDVKAVHLAPTEAVLGFPRALPAVERLEVLSGVEVDYSSNELGGVLQGVLKGNGNYLERFLSGHLLASSPLLDALLPLVRGALSRRVARHYLGFATQQRRAWEEGGRTSAKKLLYVLRTTLTGTHLLRTGEVVTDVTALLPRYGLDEAQALVAEKRRGEHAALPEALASAWADRLDGCFHLLETAEAQSPLPEAPANAAELEAVLVQLRLERLGASR